MITRKIDPRAIKTYNKLFPNIEITNNGLTDEEVEIIFSERFLLNINNKYIKEQIEKFPRDYPSILGTTKTYVSKILKHFAKKYNVIHVINNRYIKEFWLVHGYSESEADLKIQEYKNDLENRRKTEVVGHVLTKYNSLGIDVSHKEKLDRNDIEKIIFHIDKHFKPSSNALKTIVDKIYNSERNFPSFSEINTEIKNLVNPTNTPGGSTMLKSFYTIRGWSDDEAEQKVSLVAKSCSIFSVEYYKNLGYNEKDAKTIISDIQKYNSRFSIEHWLIKGFSYEEAKNVIEAEKQLTRENSKFTIDYWLVRGYGIDEAIRRQDYYKTKCKENNPTCKEYWLLKGKTLKEAISFSKIFIPSCIEYWKMIYKNEEDAVAAKNNYLKNIKELLLAKGRNSSNQSKIATECLLKIKNEFPKYDIETVTSEYSIRYNSTRYYYDYTDHTNKIIIEFNGTIWHSSEEAKLRDKLKKELCEKQGYKLFYITEKEYKENPNETVLNLLNIIKEIVHENNKNRKN